MMVHLMSAGRLQLFDTRASLRDRTSRLLVRLDDGRELRLREFGTKQRAWVKLLRSGEVDEEETIAALGPEAWPDPPPFEELLVEPRPLYALLRDQHVIAGIGRSWVDEILHAAKISPFKRGSDLGPTRRRRCGKRPCAACRMRSPTTRRRCRSRFPTSCRCRSPSTAETASRARAAATALEAVFYEDYVMCYCPTCQTEGKLLKDRRLSRLLK